MKIPSPVLCPFQYLTAATMILLFVTLPAMTFAQNQQPIVLRYDRSSANFEAFGQSLATRFRDAGIPVRMEDRRFSVTFEAAMPPNYNSAVQLLAANREDQSRVDNFVNFSVQRYREATGVGPNNPGGPGGGQNPGGQNLGPANPRLDRPFNVQEQSLRGLAAAIFQFGIILCIIAAAVYIAIGSFYYFAAAGNASLAGQGKEIIQRSIIGLLLALIAWVLLNTISPQFTQLRDPQFGGGQQGR